MEEKLYYLAAIETIVNKNYAMDLDDYYIEYFLDIEKYMISFYGSNDVAVTIGIKIKNKTTKEIVWANIYYKILFQNVSIDEIDKNLLLEQFLSKPLSQKIDFIFKSETILKKAYIVNDFVKPNSFTKELKITNSTIYPSIILGGTIPKHLKYKLSGKLQELLREMKEEVTLSKKINKYLQITNKI